jgi:hypothetical protein
VEISDLFRLQVQVFFLFLNKFIKTAFILARSSSSRLDPEGKQSPVSKDCQQHNSYHKDIRKR